MAGSRRVQRSIRVMVAGTLVFLAVCGVIAALVLDASVSASAVAAAVVAVVAARILYSEIVQTRRDHAKERALQAKSFGAALATQQQEHSRFTEAMHTRVRVADRTIGELNGTIRLAEARADEAEHRVMRESRRANDAQSRLSELLDEVLAQQTAALDDIENDADLNELPTIIDLLAWEERVNEQVVDELRREA